MSEISMSDNWRDEMLKIDGSQGEGGGQILRTALSLSMVTGRGIRIEKIRDARSRPGLMRQHLTAVKAAAAICGAEVEGAELRSQSVTFSPGAIRGGEYHFQVGTAGSTMLVLQTILLPLLFADAPSRVVLEGGTHAMNAPPFEFVERVYLPILQQLGADISIALERYGFFPAGGGRVVLEVEPLSNGLGRLELMDAGAPVKKSLMVVNAFLAEHIATREWETFSARTGWPEEAEIELTENAECPGNIMMAIVSFGTHDELISELGKPGRPAEEVAERCAKEVLRFLESGAAVGEFLCDQLLLPMALGQGGRFTAQTFSEHSRTQVWLIEQFVDVDFEIRPAGELTDAVEVRVERLGA